jgi:hypothetical protein
MMGTGSRAQADRRSTDRRSNDTTRPTMKGIDMQLRIIGAIAIVVGFVAGSTVASSAQGQQTTPSEPSSVATEKQQTPRQQRMKNCAAKWKDEKAEKHVSGREAYRAFMKECLKK